jgi:tetratricopeptide (TPR) repeat protein
MLARGSAALWLGHFDEAAADFTEGLRLARAAGDSASVEEAGKRQRHLALWRERSAGGSPEARCREAMEKSEMGRAGLIGDCTAAFLAATTPFDKADLLTIRSIAWLVGHQDEPASIADQEVAVGLDPGNHQWRANLGGSYRQARHSWAGKRELDRSLAIQVTWVALAERAAAHYNLGDREGALADARKSFELHPNLLALIVLGDLAKDRGDTASAKLYWMGAYHLGSRDDDTIARLKSIGIDHPEQEPKPK